MGHARETVLPRHRDPRVGHRLFRAPADRAGRRAPQLHSVAAEDLQRRGHAHHRAAVLLQVRARSGPSRTHVQISQVQFHGECKILPFNYLDLVRLFLKQYVHVKM